MFQVAVSQRLLPLRCVVCRAKVLRLRQARDQAFPTSVSQYSMSAVAESARILPTSYSLYSFTPGSSGISGKNYTLFMHFYIKIIRDIRQILHTL